MPLAGVGTHLEYSQLLMRSVHCSNGGELPGKITNHTNPGTVIGIVQAKQADFKPE